jgi:hypothetical protein
MATKTPEQQAADLKQKFEQMEAQRKAEEALATMLIPLIEKKDIYYVGETHHYMMYEKVSGWKSYSPEAIAKLFALTKPNEKIVFDECLRKLERIKEHTAISFNEMGSNVLNFLSVEDWLQPEKGPIEPIFDILMDSLSGGKVENREHLEQCIVYKYMHPEDYLLPCITISGAGGAGKNELVERVFATIFGDRQVVVLGTDSAFGQFNGQMIGKTVVFIDEAIVEKGDAEALKRKVGNKTISINEKYGLQGNYDNTPWYWLGGNGTNGAVMLAKDTTDRRYSVLTVKHSIMFWVAKHLGMSELPKPGVVLPASHPAVIWYRDNMKHLSDPKQVARWLMSIILKWGNQKHVPGALHSIDYQNVINSQKSSFENAMEHVFGPKFHHIEGKTLYRVYCAINKEETDKKGFTKHRNKFLTDAQQWVERNRPDILWKKMKFKISGHGEANTYTTGWMFIVDGKSEGLTRNDHRYIKTDDRGNDQIVEAVEGDNPVGEIENTFLA